MVFMVKLLIIMIVMQLTGVTGAIVETVASEAQGLNGAVVTNLTHGAGNAAKEETENPEHLGGAGDDDFEEDEDEIRRFDAFLEEYTIEILEDDYLTMHYKYEDPEAAGIDRKSVEVTFGDVVTDREEALEDAAELKKDLASFDYHALNQVQRGIYDDLALSADLTEKLVDEKFDYLDNLWSSSGGVHQVFIQVFSEYNLYCEQDVADMITLLEDVPRFVDESLEYTKEQAERGMLCFDYDAVMEVLDDVLGAKNDSAVIKSLEKSIDAVEELSDEQKESYKEEMRTAVNECLYPSYEKMKKELRKLKKQVLPIQGLAKLPEGEEYYELLLQDTIGSTDSVEDVRQTLEYGLSRSQNMLAQLMKEDPTLEELDLYSLQSGMDSIEEILKKNLREYRYEFPEVGEMDYELDGINDERAGDFSAFFIIPTLDSTIPYQIRYNIRSLGEEVGTLDMYNTISHEGIPGHMYQAQFNKENLTYPIQFLSDNQAFTEGWAVYAANVAMDYIKTKDFRAVMFYDEYINFLNTLAALWELEINYDGLTEDEFCESYAETGFPEEALRAEYGHLADNRVYYMPYYYGYHEIMNLREYAEEKLGRKFNQVEFHRALLQAGSTNFETIRNNISQYSNETK